MTESANDRPMVGGNHYRACGNALQHWDLAAHFGWDYLQGQCIKYLMRWKDKNGLDDLKKAAHYLEKYIEVEEAKQTQQDTEEKAAMKEPFDRIITPYAGGSDHEWAPDGPKFKKCAICGVTTRVFASTLPCRKG